MIRWPYISPPYMYQIQSYVMVSSIEQYLVKISIATML